MKLTIKTLSQLTFKIDIDPDKTVKQLKDQIESEHGKDYACGSQKLIYSGKILADETKLSEHQIDEKKFIVLMITRPPAAPKPATTAPEKPAPASSATNPAPEPKTEAAKRPATRSSTAAASVSATSAASTPAPVLNPASSANVPAQSAGAVTANSVPPARTTAPQSRTADPSGGARQSSLLDDPMNYANLGTRFYSQPQFRQMQDLIQQSPHLLSSTIDALAASDPEMYAFITENPDVFVNALNQPPLSGVAQHSTPSRGSQGHQQRSRPSAEQAPALLASGGRQQGGVEQMIVNVTQHDKEAIERLKELGFSEYLAVQAYMACDKDEQLAANLLFQMEQ